MLILNGAATQAPADGSLITFESALRRALEVNNTIERARSDIEIADTNRRQVLSAVMPRITTTGSLTRNSEEVSFGSDGDTQTVQAANDWNYRVVLSQPVFAGFREGRAYAQAKIGIENARQAERGTEDQILLRVASNYLAAVDADAHIELEKRNIELAEKRRTQSQHFYEAGEVTRVDVLRAETAIKAAQRLLAVAVQNRETAVGRLRADLDLDGPLSVSRPARPLPALPLEESLVRRASEQRPDVIFAENNLRIAALEVRKQRGYWYPTVAFDGGWINQKSEFPSPRYAYGALRFTVPMLQSGEVEARVAEAREREMQSRLLVEDARVTAREDVRRALVDLNAAETSRRLATEQLAAAEAEYAQAFELYRAQEATSLDLASSEQSLAEARRAVAEETRNRDLAELRVWYAAGSLQEALGLK